MRVILTDYSTYEPQIRRVRDIVFVGEQAVAPEEEHDERDSVCAHVLVLQGDQAIATGRLDFDKQGKIGRVAVLAEFRRRGIGRLVMQRLEDEARRRGLARLWFHAQVAAIPFYRQLGYQSYGDEFMEAGILHVRMEKYLEPTGVPEA